MSAAIFIQPVRPGRHEEFRSLVADLMTSRRIEWAQSHRDRGITRQVVNLAADGDRWLAVFYVEAADPVAAMTAGADGEFGVWLHERLAELLEPTLAVESLADTAPKPGPWRGWRRVRR